MSEINIKNLEAGQAACDTLQIGVSKVDVTNQVVSQNPFEPLSRCNPDLGSKFISELKSSMDDINNFLKNHVLPAAISYFQPDNPTDDNSDQGGYVSRDDGNGGGNGGGDGGDNPDDTPVDEIITPAVVINSDDTKQINGETLNDMKLSELDGFVGTMIGLSKQHEEMLDEYVMNDQYADEIKQAILDSPYIPQEFKDEIKDLDSQVVRKYIEGLLKGQDCEVFDINTTNLGIVYKYLEQVASENGITVEQLLSDPQYAELLKVTLSQFKNLVELFKGWEDLPPEEIQKMLLQFYDGDGVDDFAESNISMVRAFVDFISEETTIPYEELLMDTSYAEVIKDAVMSLGKTSSFLYLTSEFTQEGMQQNVMQLFDGTNYKAFGMDENSVNLFKEEMDTLAKENNTTTDNLLTDSTYADSVKETLKNSAPALGVGSIFKNAPSTVSQNVAKNLYNTKFEQTTSMELDGSSQEVPSL